MELTAGSIVLKSVLPKDMHKHLEKPLDAKGIKNLFNDLADKHEDSYKDIVSKLTRLGFETSTRLGSSVSLEDLKSPIDKNKRFAEIEQVVADIHKGEGTKAQKEAKEAAAYVKFLDDMNKEVLDAGLKSNKTLAKIILSGSRGSPTQYRQTVAAPGIVPGPDGKPLLAFPIKRSFAEGLSPAEYLAHSFGTRTGLAGTKLAVADAGALSKTIFRSSMTIKVEEHDCGTHKGIPITVDDKDYVGSFLAQPVGEFKYNNEVTLAMLNKLKDAGITDLVVRSPITCESNKTHHHGAVCQLCTGRRDKKHLPVIGDYLGVTAGTTLGEKMSQMTLASKHSGSTVKKQQLSGFKLVNQLFNIPDTFRDKAPLAEVDGVVTKITAPAQGGHEVFVKHGSKEVSHYVPTGFDVKVAVGDNVEAGDVLSEGLVNPSDVVRLKGIGEGRRYAAKALKNAFDDSGLGINHRNFDIITRNAIDHVRITDPDGIGHYLPNQIVSYNNIEKDYQARNSAKQVRVGDANGMYLETPVLHYTIGTKITNSIIAQLRKNKIDSILVHDKPPGFHPEMQRLLDIPAHEDDWMHQLYSTYIQKRFLDAVNQGMATNLHGASPIAGLAAGTIGLKKKAEHLSLHELKEEVESGVKVAAQLYGGAWFELTDSKNGSVTVSNNAGYSSRKTWDMLNHVFKGAAEIEKDAAAKLGCLMVMFNPSDAEDVLSFHKRIPAKELVEEGLEDEVHVTVLYGFKDTVDIGELKQFLSDYGNVSLKLGKVSRFERPERGYDVIKVEVTSEELHKLNAALREKFKGDVEVTFPDYKPHMTLAYVRPGALKHLDGDKTFKDKSYTFSSLVYSSPGETERTIVPLKPDEDLMVIDD